MKKILLTSLILFSAFFIVGCTNNGQSNNYPTEEEQMMESTNVNDQMDNDQSTSDDQMMEDSSMSDDQMMSAEEITLDASDYKYSQNVIKAKAGETVTLTLTNSEGFHDLVIDELNVKTSQISEGETDTVTFTIPENASGEEYEYYCSVGQHRQLGMVGTLIVE